MPVAIVFEGPGMAAETYDAVNEKMDVVNDPPAGLMAHAAGLAPNGNWRIFDVWESVQAYERFAENRLNPALDEVLGDNRPSGPPNNEIYELHNVMLP